MFGGGDGFGPEDGQAGVAGGELAHPPGQVLHGLDVDVGWESDQPWRSA